MKHVLLTALSLLLLGNCPALADERTSAGQATPVKLGGGDRAPKPASSTATKKNAEQEQTGTAEPAKAGTGAAGQATATGQPTGTAAPGQKAAGQKTAAPKIPFGSWRLHKAIPGKKLEGFSAPGVTNTVGAGKKPSWGNAPTPAGATAGAGTGNALPTAFSTAGTKTAFGGKGLIPPPPNVMNLLPPTAAGKAPKKGKGKPVPPEKMVTVGTGGPYIFHGKPKEEFATTFNWQPDAPGDTLTYKATFTPIGQGNPHFNWIRIMLGSQIVADERALKGKDSFVLDLTGKVENGINQFVVSGQGTNGATIDWKLTTPKKCKLISLDPDEVLVGKDLTLKGQGFDPTPTKDTVTIGSKTLNPSTATATELKVRIPKDFTPGEYMVKVTVDGMASHELKVTIRGIPELSGTNLNGCPPGSTLVIFGKNFSKKISDNQVMFDNTSAAVINATTTELTVLVPNFSNEMAGDTARLSGQVGIPIRVRVGKIEAANTVPINVGNSTWQEPGMRGGPDAPQVPVDWRRLLEN